MNMMSPDPLALLHDRLTTLADDPTLELRVHPGSVALGRRFVTTVLAGMPDDHLWAAVQCTSELLTNALAAAERHAAEMPCGWSHLDSPVHLTVRTAPRWTRIDVRDPEPCLHPAGPHEVLGEGGRGIEIIAALGHFAYTIAADHKVVHALIPADGPLTDDERTAALPRHGMTERTRSGNNPGNPRLVT
jgi:hypothetical protein